MASSSTRYPPGTGTALTPLQLATIAYAETHVSSAPGVVDYVLDEVQATTSAVAVFDNAATATLLSGTTTVGPGASTTGTNAVAIGSNAAAAEQGVGVGRNSYADPNGTALGVGAYAETGNTALGFGADATGTETTAVGRASQTTGTSGTALGYNARALLNDSTALGSGALAGAAGCTAVGRSAQGTDNATAVGYGANASQAGAVALGLNAAAAGQNSVAILGTTSGNDALAILGTADAGSISIRGAASGGNAIAIGQSSAALATCVSLGVSTSSAGGNSVALGTWANASGVRSLALGGGIATGATAAGTNAIALGELSIAGGTDATAIGRGASASATDAVALGRATAGGVDSVAVGRGASSAGLRAIAIGQGASAAAADSVAVGSAYLAGSMAGTKHLSPAAAVGVDLGTTSLPYASLYTGVRLTDWAYQRYPATGGNGGITVAAVTATTGNVPLAFATGAGDTAKAASSGFTNTGVLSVAAVPYVRTFFVVIRGIIRYNPNPGDGTNDRGAVLYIPASSATTAYSVVAPAVKSQDGSYSHRVGSGYVTVLAGAAFTFTPRIASAGGLSAECIQVEYHVVQV